MRTKASRAQHVTSGWYVIVTNEADGYKRKVMLDSRYNSLGVVRWVQAPVELTAENYQKFLELVNFYVTSVKGVSPKKWKVILAVTHGRSDGGISYDPLAGKTCKVPSWGTASQWFLPLYSAGVRRLHIHTCDVGHHLAQLELTPRPVGAPKEELMIVTAWRSGLKTFDYEVLEQGNIEWHVECNDLCYHDGYIFRGCPLTTTMRQGQGRGYNAIFEVHVSPEGQVRRRASCIKGKI